MLTHSYCRNCQAVTSSVLQRCGISSVLVTMLCLHYNTEMFHFKSKNRIPNSGPTMKLASKTMLSKNSLHNFRTPVSDKKTGQKRAKIRQVNTVYSSFNTSHFCLVYEYFVSLLIHNSDHQTHASCLVYKTELSLFLKLFSFKHE